MRSFKAALVLGLLLLAAPPAAAENTVGPTNQILCNKFAIQNASTASLATLVAGVSNQAINICGWSVTSSNAAATTFTLSSGTGTNCGTTNSAFTPPYNVTSTAPAVDHTAAASLSLPAGANLCVISSGTSLQIGVWYSQF